MIFGRRRIKICDFRKDKEFVADRAGLQLLIGSLLDHAMSSGMTKLALGLNPEDKSSWMRFYGPHWYRAPIWHELVPLWEQCYPMILQVCLGLAELGPEFPPKGVIPASKGGKKLLLDLEVSDIHSFQLWWPKSFASDQASNPDFPNEEIHSGAKKTA